MYIVALDACMYIVELCVHMGVYFHVCLYRYVYIPITHTHTHTHTHTVYCVYIFMTKYLYNTNVSSCYVILFYCVLSPAMSHTSLFRHCSML